MRSGLACLREQQAPGAWVGRAQRTNLACFWPRRRINAWKLCANRGGITRAKEPTEEPTEEPELGGAGGRRRDGKSSQGMTGGLAANGWLYGNCELVVGMPGWIDMGLQGQGYS